MPLRVGKEALCQVPLPLGRGWTLLLPLALLSLLLLLLGLLLRLLPPPLLLMPPVHFGWPEAQCILQGVRPRRSAHFR